MLLKTYDEWTSVTSDDGKKAILAKFTKEDDTVVHYNFAALHRIKKKPSENFGKEDLSLISRAIADGPKFFKAYDGWRNFGRDGKTIMLCAFTKSSGEKVRRNLTALQNMAASPPPKFSPYDRAVLETALSDAPSFKR